MNKDYSRWFIPMDKNLTIDQIIQDGGFYDIDGLWNSIISIEGKLYRGRVETLILDGTTLFMAPDKHRTYRVPGGSLDKGVENARQAENECKEEARIVVKNTTYSGVHYIREYENKSKPEPGKVIWDGTYTEVYVAEFDTYYHGYIDKKDLDPGMAKDGRFRELSEVKDILTEPHKEALKDILDQVIDTEPTLYTAKESTVLTEKDVDNFFMLTEEDINEAANVGEEDKIHPYFTPEEMLYLGVMSESGNYYSDEAKIDNYTKDWFQNYRSNGKVGISSDWVATLQDRYEEFINTGSETSKQEILNLGWNPEIPPTMENIKRVSDDKEKEEIPDPVENMNEGYLFSKKDIMHNIGKFESGECNICFVTGLMGSGKSTLAKNLGEYYKARVIELDVLQNYSRFLYDKDMNDGDRQIMKITNEFLKKNKDIHLYDFDEIRTESFKKFFNEFFPVMVRSLERDKKHRYIVEGVHIFLFVSPELLKDYPVVFMNASMAKSMFRRWKRDQFTPMDFVKYGSDDFKLFVEWEDKFKMFQKSFYETYLFLSEQDMDGEVIVPRIPHNYFTENYYEDTITPRVCLSSTIEGALKAISSKRKIGTEFYVHTPMHECTIYHPTEQQVPDCKLTGEVWSKEPVRMTTIGKIRVTESTVTESFTYGKGLTGILNGYSYEWETMYDENLCSLIEFREHKEKEDFPSIVKRFFDTLRSIVDKYSKKEPDLHLTCKIMDSTDAGRREINFIICDEDQGTRIKASNVILQISKELSKDKYIKRMAYKIHCGDGDEGCIYCKLKLNVMKESFLVEMKRSELPDDIFGIPSERKYPMPDEKHVLSAIRFFNYVEPKYEKQLASKIIANMKKYGISGDRVGEKNRLRNYLPKTMVKEEYDFISISDEDKNHIRSIINTLSDDMDNFDGFQFMNVADYEIAFDKNKPVGFAMVRLKPLSDDRYAGSISIAINPKYRRKGIAEYLVKVIISRSYDKSIDYLYWKVDPKNTASINLAKKCGFKYSNTKKGMKVYRYNISSVKESLSESVVEEGYFKSDKDIYYNKDKFDSGEINLCFITGLSGSGKSTMGRRMSSKDVEHYEMDDVICNDNFSDNNLKEYGGLIESFFKGSGKSFRLIRDDDNHNDSVFKSHKNYEKEITQAFVKHAISYCKSHKETKYVCDGIWIFMFIKPEQLKDCTVYIKGTSSIKSGYRALKRDIDEDKRNSMTSLQIFKREFKRVKEDVLYAKENQKELKSFRSYFEKQLTNESYVEESSNNKVYHLSQTNLDGKTIQPTVPSNYMTKNGYEDDKTKRVCFATSIDGCLRGLSLKCERMKLFVHVPDGNYNIYKPSNKEVPDASITGEVWIKKAVKMKCIGQIYVIGDKGEDGIPYKYGNNTAYLYDWKWKWINKKY